jgi:SAM-dependent methyltransferase
MKRRHALAALGAVSALQAQAPAASAVSPGAKMWNDLYSRTEPIVNPFPNRFLARSLAALRPGRALDVGMGQGRNTLYLASQGWETTGVDISEKGVALARKQANARKLNFHSVVANFNDFDLGKAQWDLITEMYLHGLVIRHTERVVESLRPGGHLMVEGFHQDGQLKGFNGGALGFAPNELLAAFVPKLRIVHYEEVRDFGDWSLTGEQTMVVRMLARKAGAA